MELSRFIEETITQIVNGVKLAQENTKDSGAKINPLGAMSSGGKVYTLNRSFIDVVDFEVALTRIDEKEGKGGIGVFLGGFGIGGQEKTAINNMAVTNIKFSIPIVFPMDEMI
jgi:hypothetical protein